MTRVEQKLFGGRLVKSIKFSVVFLSLLLTLAACGNTPAAPPANPGAGADGDPTAPAVTTPTAQPENPSTTTPATSTPVNTTPVTTPAPTPEPPSPLKYLELRVEPATVDMGSPAVVIVTVNNTGDKFGTFPVELKIDGSTYSVQTVSLGAGQASNMTFNIIPMAERNMILTAGGLFKELIIQHS